MTTRLVYSTDGGDKRRASTPPPPSRPAQSVVLVRASRQGRSGKLVTLVEGVGGDDAALSTQAAALRRLCHCGGTLRDGVIELQGDHCAEVAAILGGHGRRVRVAGS